MNSHTKEGANSPVVRTRVSIDMECSCYPLLVDMEEPFVNIWVKTAVELMALSLHGGSPRVKQMLEDSKSLSRKYLPRKSTKKVGAIIKARVLVTTQRFAYRYVVGLDERNFRAWVHNALDFMAICLTEDASGERSHVSPVETPVTTKSPRPTERKNNATGATKVSNASNIGVDKDDFLEMLADPSRWGK